MLLFCYAGQYMTYVGGHFCLHHQKLYLHEENIMSNSDFVRHFSRIPFDAEASILSSDGSQKWPCTLLDISLNGALTSLPDDWTGQRGDKYKLELQLGSLHEEALRLHMDVTVSHIENDHIGLQILQMDVDTASHLHRLVELNSGDPQILQREFAELIKQHMNAVENTEN